jgi:hypothetical protein
MNHFLKRQLFADSLFAGAFENFRSQGHIF